MFQKDESGEDDIVDLKLNEQPPNSGALSTQGENKQPASAVSKQSSSSQRKQNSAGRSRSKNKQS